MKVDAGLGHVGLEVSLVELGVEARQDPLLLGQYLLLLPAPVQQPGYRDRDAVEVGVGPEPGGEGWCIAARS